MTYLLDNEPISVLLAGPAHNKFNALIAEIQYATTARRPLVVPTAVRVEAEADRTTSRAALLGLHGIQDAALDTTSANAAATIVTDHGVSVADAHLSAVARTKPGCTVLTSDPDDIRRSTDLVEVTIVQI